MSKVCQIKSIDYIKQPIQGNAWRKRYEVGILIPLSDCNYIQEELNNDQFAGLIVNKEYFFTNRDIAICENIHTVKQVRDKVFKKSAWFKGQKTVFHHHP